MAQGRQKLCSVGDEAGQPVLHPVECAGQATHFVWANQRQGVYVFAAPKSVGSLRDLPKRPPSSG